MFNNLGCIYYEKEKIDRALLTFQTARETAKMELQRRSQEKTPEIKSLLQCLGIIFSNIGRVSFMQKQ